MKRFLRCRRGMALPMIAIMLPVFSLIMVFSIDFGLAQTGQLRLERAVNRAVDVAVVQMADPDLASASAESVIFIVLSDIGRFGKNLDVSVSTDSNEITVLASFEGYSFFGGLAGYGFYDISAQASRTLLP